MGCQEVLETGLPRRNEAIITVLIFIANIITDILVCWDFYKDWTSNTHNESNVFSIFIIAAILITNSFQLNVVFRSYKDTTSSLLQQLLTNSSCNFLFIFLYSFGCIIGFTQPLFLLIMWRLNQMTTNINWYIFRELNRFSAKFQSSMGGTLQIYLLISEQQYNNSLLIISIIISILSYSINISSEYRTIITTNKQKQQQQQQQQQQQPQPYYTFYLFYISIVCDYLIRSVVLSLTLNIMINDFENTTSYYMLWVFFVITYLIIYVIYFFRVYFEYQVKFNWLHKVFRFNKDLSDLKDIRNFYIFKAVYYPILTLLRGCNSGWFFIVRSDPKQITKSFIKKCVKNQIDADQLKVDVINNWTLIKDPIYALCKINLLEILIKYISNIIMFIIVAVIIGDDDNNFTSWSVVLSLAIIIFIVAFCFWLKIVWQHPLIHDYVFIDNIKRQKTVKQEALAQHIENTELQPIKTEIDKNDDNQFKE